MNRLVGMGFALLGLVLVAGAVVEALFLFRVWPTGIATWKLGALVGLDVVFAAVLFLLAVVIWRARRATEE